MKTTKDALLKQLNTLLDNYYEETGVVITKIETSVLDSNNLYRTDLSKVKKNIQISGIKPGNDQLDYYENDKKVRTEYK